MKNSKKKTVVPVSVVIPCFCCAKTIIRAIVSVAQQTQKPAEVILVDDGSHDNTLAILQKLAEQYDGWIKVIALPENQGVANARNAGWAMATQRYIAFLDADDAWHPRKLEIQTAYMNAHPEVILCGHQHKIMECNTRLPDWRIIACQAKHIPKLTWLLSNQFVTPSVMIRRNACQGFQHNQRYMEDYGLWLDFVCSGQVVTKLSVELAATYKNAFGADGLSAELWRMEHGELSDYKHLFNKQYINGLGWTILSVYSLLKFIRRLVIYWGWLRWRRHRLA